MRFGFHSPFKMEEPIGFHLPFEMEVPVRSIYLLGFVYLSCSIYLSECPSGSIHPSGWKSSWGPFTLRDGSACRVHLLFGLRLPFGFHLPFKIEIPFGLYLPFRIEVLIGLESTSRVHLPFGLESNCRVHLPFRMEMPIWFHLPLRMEVPDGSIYSSGWKYLSGPFTLQDGNARQVHLPFGFHLSFKMEVLIGSIYPSGWKVNVRSIYPLG